MAIDPNILKIGGNRGLNLNVTPGSVAEPGRTIGGRFQVGAPQTAVGPSGDEALYANLSAIAGGIVDSAQNIAQLAEFNNNVNWQDWYADSWEGDKSKRRAILDNKELSSEEKRNQLIKLLDEAPSNGANKTRKAQLYGDWLDQDPDSTAIFQSAYTTFQQETLTLAPEDRLRQFEYTFGYELAYGNEQAVAARLGYERDVLNFNNENAITQGKLALERNSGYVNDVLDAMLSEELGDNIPMQELRRQAEAEGSLPQFEQTLGQAQLIRENRASADVIQSVLLSNLNINSSSEIFSPFDQTMSNLITAKSTQLSREYGLKMAKATAVQEETNKAYTRMSFSQTPLNVDPSKNGAEIAALLATINPLDGKDRNEATAALISSLVTTTEANRFNYNQAITFSTDLFIKAWETATPSQRRILSQMGFVPTPPAISPEDLKKIYDQPSFASTNRDKIELAVTGVLSSNDRFAKGVSEQLTAAIAPFETLQIEGPQSAYGLAVALDATVKQLGMSGNSPAFLRLEALRSSNTSNRLRGENGLQIWTLGLGLPPEDYELFIAANTDGVARTPEINAVIAKYGKLPSLTEEMKAISDSVSKGDKLTQSLNKKINETIDSVVKAVAKTGGPTVTGVFEKNHFRDLTTAANNFPERSGVVDKLVHDNPALGSIAQKTVEAASKFTYGKTIGNNQYSFEIPQAANGIPLPKQLTERLKEISDLRQKELDALLKESPIAYKAKLNDIRAELNTLAVQEMVLMEASNNPSIVGNKPEELASQQAALRQVVETTLRTQDEYAALFRSSNISPKEPFLSPIMGDNDVATIQLVDGAGNTNTENYSRLVYRVTNGTSDSNSKFLPTLQKAFTALGSNNGNAQLTMETSKQEMMYLFAVADGIAAKATIESKGDPYVMLQRVQTRINQLLVGSDLSSYRPTLRKLVELKLADNPEFGKTNGVRFIPSDPNDTFARLTGTAKKTLTDKMTAEQSRLDRVSKYLFKSLMLHTEDNIRGKGMDLTKLPQSTSWGGSGTQDFITNAGLLAPFNVRTLINDEASISIRDDGNAVLGYWEQSGWKIPGNSETEKQTSIVVALANASGMPVNVDKDGIVSLYMTTYDDSRNLSLVELTNDNFGFIVETLTGSLSTNRDFTNFLEAHRTVEPNSTNLVEVLSTWQDYDSFFGSSRGNIVIPNYRSYEVGSWKTLNWGTDPAMVAESGNIIIPAEHEKYRMPMLAVPDSIQAVPGSFTESNTIEEDRKNNPLFDDERYIPGMRGKESTYATIWLFGERPKNRLSEDAFKEDLTKIITSALSGQKLNPSTIAKINDSASRLAGGSDARSKTNAMVLMAANDILGSGFKILPDDLFAVGNGIFSDAASNRDTSTFKINFGKDAKVTQLVSTEDGTPFPVNYRIPFDPSMFPVELTGSFASQIQLSNMQRQLDFIRENFIHDRGHPNYGHPWIHFKGDSNK